MANSKKPEAQQPEFHQNSLSRRSFVAGATALSVAAAAGVSMKAAPAQKLSSKRILVGTHTPEGILSFAWDAKTGTLTPEGVAAVVTNSTWLEFSPDQRYLYVACELDEFQGKPTAAVASYGHADGKLTALSQVDSQGVGSCHVTTDHTGHIVLVANYMGGSAASFVAHDGKLGAPAWSEHYKGYPGHGPVADRQEMAHAHFASISPDNRYAYINDLGADKIHIYKLDHTSGVLTHAGTYKAEPGDGPRTLHFHKSGKVAYCINELNSSVKVLAWNAADGSLRSIQKVELSPDPAKGPNTGCDIVLTGDGRFAYVANRGDDFLASFHIDPATGKLTPFAKNGRIATGGKTPRNFRLDPTERWMLVANQSSGNLTVFARDPRTGVLSGEGKNTPAATPMCIVFV